MTPDFSVTFKADYVKTLEKDDQVVIYYTAILNDQALIVPQFNYNDTFLTYSNQETKIIRVKVYTYEFDLVKDNDSKTLLAGAEFQLYRADQFVDGKPISGATPISFWKSTDGKVYRVKYQTAPTSDFDSSAATDTLTTLSSAALNLEGLDVGDYYLVETKAPDGYNPLTTPIKVTVSANIGSDTTVTGTKVLPVTGTVSGETITYTPASGATATDGAAEFDNGKYTSGGVEVINQSGTTLPSTGGIGTTIFYIIGGLLAVGAGVVLVTKKRMGKEEN